MRMRLPKSLLLILSAAVAAPAIAALLSSMAPADLPDFEALCATGQPFYAVASYRAQNGTNQRPNPGAPSIILFKDTPDDNEHYALTTFQQTGAVWGLAYDAGRRTLYASTYHKRGLPYGPEGPGGIYKIDLATGDVSTFAVVPNAGTRQRNGTFTDGSFDHDANQARNVGKVALGDLDLSDDGTELFVVNLNDRLIYRYDVTTGALIGSFPHGALNESWARDARPFALDIAGGYVYHGLVNARGPGAAFVAKIYRSLPDGSDMTEVASFPLKYTRDRIVLRRLAGSTVTWGPWSDALADLPKDRGDRLHAPQPMLTDLLVTGDGGIAIALRDRYWDMNTQWVNKVFATVTATVVHQGIPTPNRSKETFTYQVPENALGFGDVLYGTRSDTGFDVGTDPERFDDANAIRHGESALGGLACGAGASGIASTSYGVERAPSETTLGEEGVYWYEIATGSKTSKESLGVPGSIIPFTRLHASNAVSAHGPNFDYNFATYLAYYRDVASLGDLEALCADCGAEFVPPTFTPVPTDTPEIPTDTPTPDGPPPTDTPVPPTDTPTPTDTPVDPTVTPTNTPGSIYLPILLREHCDPSLAKADVVLVLDASVSMTGAKIAAAKDAAVGFVQTMDLPDDHVGVVTFSAAATLVSPLSGDAAAVEAAIMAITTSPGTRIDTGLAIAEQLLADPARTLDRTPVVIVLTDGLQVDRPELPAQVAGRLRAAGVLVFAVGLGADVDTAALHELTADPNRVFLSPTIDELRNIYVTIARLIPCPASAYWGNR
ncbi:MAG: vWA domain-containing protein [Ardenticatenales bacterium]